MDIRCCSVYVKLLFCCNVGTVSSYFVHFCCMDFVHSLLLLVDENLNYLNTICDDCTHYTLTILFHCS